METSKILQSDYLDLIFDNRNKNYGGYELRKHYNGRALKALGITFSILLLGIATPFLLGKLNAKDNAMAHADMPDEIQLTDILMSPPPAPPDAPKPPEPANAAPPPAAKTLVFTEPEIVPQDVKLVEPLPDMEELKHAVAGAVANPGEGGDVAATTADKHTGPFGNGGSTELKGGNTGGVVNDEPVKFAPVMPEYPGGMAALLDFIRSNLKYPAMAREEGIEGRVVVTFIVNTKGEIENARVIKGIGGGCDKEALRVVNAMPKWKPGKQQNGQPVKVYYTLPISFKLQ